jgi:hypothetical protein
VQNILGKGLKILGEDFADYYTQQRHVGKDSLGKVSLPSVISKILSK